VVKILEQLEQSIEIGYMNAEMEWSGAKEANKTSRSLDREIGHIWWSGQEPTRRTKHQISWTDRLDTYGGVVRSQRGEQNIRSAGSLDRLIGHMNAVVKTQLEFLRSISKLVA
jgi:hypothetical protein